MKKNLLILLVPIIYLILYRIYVPRITAFGCFDDCFTFSAGYFIGKGKELYSQIFYNHQLLPVYLSFLIQTAFQPQNLFDLVLRHRQSLFLFGFLFNILLVARFRLPAFLFFIFFEFTKFYIFGDRFLAEGILAYPLTYLVFLSWEKLRKIKIRNYEFILAALFSWLIIFLREAFIPISIVLFFYLLFPLKKSRRFKIYSLSVFLLLTLVSLSTLNLKDYFFELYTVNRSFFATEPNILKSIIYPLEILARDKLNLFNFVLFGIDIVFLASLFYFLVKKNFKVFLVFIPLILTNIRVVTPGRLFYESFHMVPFYATFLSITFILMQDVKNKNRNLWVILFLLISVTFTFFISSPRVFFREQINEHDEFITNYGSILGAGQAIKSLSNQNDTLFVDGFDEAIYWVAGLGSTYKYSMYTSIMPNFSVYSRERAKMFEKTPPDFYYGTCPKEEAPSRLIPGEIKALYVRLNSFGKPSCVFVKREKLGKISKEQWEKARELGFGLPLAY